MTDEASAPKPDSVSLDKSGAMKTRARATGPKPRLTVTGEPMPPTPPTVRYALIALGVTGVAALVASLSLIGLKDWLFRQATKANDKLKVADHKTPAQLHDAVDTTVKSYIIASVVLVIALGVAGRAVFSGRHWSRWAVIGLWILATFTNTVAGFTNVLTVASDEPLVFKAATFIAAVSFIAAVVFVSLKASVTFFNLTKPARPGAAAGGAGRRGGLFGPRPGVGAAASARTAASTRAAGSSDTAGAGRARAKQRATVDSTAKGAELARARAKASKSRRTEV